MTEILKLDKVNSYYGEAHILHDVDLTVNEGETIALLGRNGAGKTTTLRSILGLTPARSGTITFKGRDITTVPTNEIANSGLGWVPDNRRIFPTLTVQQNLEIAAKDGSDGKRKWGLDQVFNHFPKLKILAKQKGEGLSGGEQQMLCIARTLMGNPDLILLDEPSEGLAPIIVQEVMKIIEELRDMNITSILVEQNAVLALRLCSTAFVMENGKIAFQGTSQELLADEDLKQRLLGI